MLLRKTENLVVASKETGLQVNADTTKYSYKVRTQDEVTV
jgi:hypothetical protein